MDLQWFLDPILVGMFSYEKELRDSNKSSNIACTHPFNYSSFQETAKFEERALYLVSLLKEGRENGMLFSTKFLKVVSII